MKKIFFIVLFVKLGLVQIMAQCQCCGSVSGFSGGDITPGAYAVEKNKWVAESFFDYRLFNGIKHQSNSQELGVSTTSALVVNHIAIGTVGIKYSISNRLLFMAQQPLFWINTSFTNSKTAGDILTLINYQLIYKEGIAVDIQSGIELPTGQFVQTTNGGSISTGSGSFDPAFGFTIKKPLKRSIIRANAFFKYTTKGFNQTYFGNFFGHQLNYVLFLSKLNTNCKPDSLAKPKTKPVVNLNFQLAGEWAQTQMRDYAYIENTGSYLILAGLGFSIAHKGFTFPIALSVPFYQRYNGEQNQTQFRLRVGITKTFN